MLSLPMTSEFFSIAEKPAQSGETQKAFTESLCLFRGRQPTFGSDLIPATQ
jgi:hypothetical protein